ncbi:unnamed protein product, partial [Heterotrigona itama]
ALRNNIVHYSCTTKNKKRPLDTTNSSDFSQLT